MNILVCSKRVKLPLWSRSPSTLSVSYYGDKLDSPPDAIVGMSISTMRDTFRAIEQYPDVPLYCYNWDCYEWVWTNPRRNEKDFMLYGKLLSKAREIWVPSECTKIRTKQWWDLDSEVVLTSCDQWFTDPPPVEDRGHILCTLRRIPDPHWSLLTQACPPQWPCNWSQHNKSFRAYKELVATCRLQVAHCYELSTGGLSLLEGYALGKPCLVSDSEWNGARDYLGDRAYYFKAGNITSMRNELHELYLNHSPPSPETVEQQLKWVKETYSHERMINDMVRRIETTL